jgi:hypothetical protein
VPAFALVLTVTTIVNVAEAPEASVAVVQTMVPVALPLVAGLVQLQPAAAEFETNFVLDGAASLSRTCVAVEGPLLATTTV